MKRRAFLKNALSTAVASGCAAGGLGFMTRAHAAGSFNAKGGDYRALVCINLEGGNDSMNMVMPRTGTAHSTYLNSRGELAVTASQMLAISGGDHGLHPGMEGVQSLFDAGDLGVVANIGTLIEPTTKSGFEGSARLPAQLFSHNDQSKQWQRADAAADVQKGWGGLVADMLQSQNTNQQLSMNVSLAGGNLFQTGDSVTGYSVSSEGTTGLGVYSEWNSHMAGAFDALRAQNKPHVMARRFADVRSNAISSNAAIEAALATGPTIATTFPNTELGRQLRMIARLISVQSTLDLSRQTFYVRNWGWDTHDAQATDHPALLADLSASMSAFAAALKEIGYFDNVATFTLSEFGRTLTSNGNGTDHAWAGHQLVMGGGVVGGQIHGRMPDLQLDGPDDIGGGRIIPDISVEQYGATLSRWFGVPATDLPLVFPHIGNFNEPVLGFI